MSFPSFNLRRFGAMVLKEFIQMRRDRMTFSMMIGVPVMQLMLFGYAINSNPKHLPTAVYSQDNGVFARSIVWAMRNSRFSIVPRSRSRVMASAVIITIVIVSITPIRPGTMLYCVMFSGL